MSKDVQSVRALWDAFLAEWPIERLRTMRLQEYTAVGDSRTFTAWIESRLDKMGSIWGGSSFKFGIYSRRDQSEKVCTTSDSYSKEYGWYTKYGASPEIAFARVRSLVLEVAEAAARGDYAAIDRIDLGEAYKWKIAYQYQNRNNPGVVAVFKSRRLRAWLKGKVGSLPSSTSGLHRQIMMLQPDRDLLELSEEIWKETAAEEPPGPDDPSPSEGNGAETSQEPLSLPLNLVLFGPPGTGKTYNTAELAVRACDGVVPEGREALLARYRELRSLQRIRFVTFHPSFTYEEFVEGIRPSTTEDGQVRYDVRPGVFKKAVTQARELYEKRDAPTPALQVKDRKLFKMSLGDSNKREDAWIFPDCLDGNYIGHGFASGVDFTGCHNLPAVRDRYRSIHPEALDTDFNITAAHYIKNEMRTGDLVLVSDGNTQFRAIAEVVGDYFYLPGSRYEQRRPVRWLWSTAESLPISLLFGKRLSQMTIYLMDQEAVNWDALRELLAPRQTAGIAPNCVLVIDEINRANLAKTFGELITLLEPSKRLGQPDEKEAELPYSGDLLGVPPNLYVIGTMNTADRSIALMDTALRRRFQFQEMAPRADLLETDLDGINLRDLLEAMNRRIESLFDRDHVLGHTYLMGLTSFESLVERFCHQIIPLLQEYFFEDWHRIQQVFMDPGEPPERQIIQDLDPATDGEVRFERRHRYQVNPAISPAAIQKIYM